MSREDHPDIGASLLVRLFSMLNKINDAKDNVCKSKAENGVRDHLIASAVRFHSKASGSYSCPQNGWN